MDNHLKNKIMSTNYHAEVASRRAWVDSHIGLELDEFVNKGINEGMFTSPEEAEEYYWAGIEHDKQEDIKSGGNYKVQGFTPGGYFHESSPSL